MTTLSLTIPSAGQPNATEDPKIASDITSIATWANGNIDGVNVVASLTGRRLIGQAAAFIGPGVAPTTNNYFIAQDGTLVASAASTTKPIFAWYLDVSNHTVAGKANTQLICRMTVSCGVSPGTAIQSELVTPTVGGSAGNVAFSFSSRPSGQATAAVATPSANSTNVAESGAGAFTFPIGPAVFAPQIVLSGTTAANSATAVSWQLFVLNN